MLKRALFEESHRIYGIFVTLAELAMILMYSVDVQSSFVFLDEMSVHLQFVNVSTVAYKTTKYKKGYFNHKET